MTPGMRSYSPAENRHGVDDAIGQRDYRAQSASTGNAPGRRGIPIARPTDVRRILRGDPPASLPLRWTLGRSGRTGDRNPAGHGGILHGRYNHGPGPGRGPRANQPSQRTSIGARRGGQTSPQGSGADDVDGDDDCSAGGYPTVSCR